MWKFHLKSALIICCLLTCKIANGQFTMPAFQATQFVNSAKITTTAISNIEFTKAVSGGVISGSVGIISYRGVCWSTNNNPTIANSRSISGQGAGTFISNVYGLASNKTYHLRAYAVNSDGKVYYGQDITFTTPQTTGYLNYSTYAVATNTVNNTTDMNNNIANAGAAFDSGVIPASTAIDYSNYAKLIAAGVGIPSNYENFALVATGIFSPTQSGYYRFTCEGDDAVDLYINNTLVVSQYGQNSASDLGTHTGQIWLSSNNDYSFRARMKENSGDESLRVYWRKPSGGGYIQDLSELRPVTNIPAEADGKIYYDGVLNYEVYTNTPTSPGSTSEMDNLFNTATVSSSGSYGASTLINFVSYNELVSAGISIPNNGDNFSLAVSGYFIPTETGTYRFTCEGDDAVDFKINNTVLVSHYGAHSPGSLGTHTGSINLTAGVKYTISARMQETGGGEVLMVFWRKPSQSTGWYQDLGEISSN